MIRAVASLAVHSKMNGEPGTGNGGFYGLQACCKVAPLFALWSKVETKRNAVGNSKNEFK